MADAPVAVALVSSYPLHIGGVEAHLLTLLRHADAARYRFYLFAPASPEFSAQAQQLGAAVMQWQLRGLTDLSGIRALRQLFVQHQIKLAHFHCPRSAFVGRLPARQLGLASIVTTHLAPWQFQQGRFHASSFSRALYLSAERFLNRRCTDHLIFVAASLCDEAATLRLLPVENVSVIRNGVDLSRFDKQTQRPAIRQQMKVDESAIVLCAVGRLDSQKGFDVLLDALAQMNFQNHWAQCWLIGDGALRDELISLATRAGLQDCVRFLGFRADVPELLQASDLFVLPSRFEATPIALLEAMAAALPCVVTDVGENAQLLNNKAGLIVPPDDAASLASAIQQLLNDAARRQTMSDAARQIAEQFSDSTMAQQTFSLYDDVLRATATR